VMEYGDVILKLELLQHSGSFKARGSFNSALAQGVPDAGLIAVSGGNHGIAVAHVARDLGVRAEIFVPSYSPATKVNRIRALGAEVDATHDLFVDAAEACAERGAQTGALSIHPFDEPLTVAGQGTTGIEIEQQVPDVDTIVVAVGGGGFAAGIAAALPDVAMVCVEPAGASAFHDAVVAGGPVDTPIDSIAADSLGAPKLGTIAWEVLGDRAETVLVTDRAIAAARQHLWDDLQLVTEHGGATAFAALQSGAWTPEPDENVVVVVCGANTDPTDLITTDLITTDLITTDPVARDPSTR
jgi:threonine dehydratase